MSQLECEITTQREDGALRWRRLGASEPNGWILPDLVQGRIAVGSIVVIDFQNNFGRNTAVSCRLRDAALEEMNLTSVNLNSADHESTRPSSGLLFWVNIMNPLENEASEGKIRPAVLVSCSGDHWRVMGLTRKSRYSSGEKRRPIPNHAVVGLNGPGFIWGGRLTRVTADSVHGFIGYANHQLVEEIVDIARNDMSPSEVDDIRSVTRPTAHQNRLATASLPTSNNSRLSLTADSLLTFLGNNDGQVRIDLVDYFKSDRYTGRNFEFFSQASNPYRFDGNDIAALMCLSISPHANISSALLGLSSRSDFQFLPGDRESSIWARPRSDFEKGGRFHNIFDELCAIPNVASVVASKLMASKFPHSIPVYDRDVSALLDEPNEWWFGWHETMQSSTLRKRLVNLRESLELHNVSLLRVIDVALWMEAQRRKKDGKL